MPRTGLGRWEVRLLRRMFFEFLFPRSWVCGLLCALEPDVRRVYVAECTPRHIDRDRGQHLTTSDRTNTLDINAISCITLTDIS
jgi:hypothetical protein